MTKVCTKCKAGKELSEFYKAKESKDGLRGTCKACAKDYGNKYRQVNKKR